MIKLATLHRIQSVYGLPEYVKAAEFEGAVNPVTALPPSAYADPVRREYPIHTKASTWASNAVYWDTAPFDLKASVDVGRRLVEAADVWGIRQDVNKILQKCASQPQGEELAAEDYALDQTVGSRRILRYPINEPQALLKSAEAFRADARLYPLSWRQATAARMLEQLDKQGLATTHEAYLHKAAGHGVSTTSRLAEAAERRAHMLRVNRMSGEGQEMLKVAQQLRKASRVSHELCRTTAQMFDQLDQASGLYQQYGRLLNLPEEDCHSVLFKDAQETLRDLVAVPGGQVYFKSDLEQLPASVFAVVPGANIAPGLVATGLQKAANVSQIKGLAPEDGRVLDLAIQAAGVAPADLGFDPRPLLS